MNLTFSSLSLIYLASSPFFAHVNKISFRNCQVSKSFNHFFFNSKSLNAQYSKFSNFLSSPIYFHSDENVTFQESLYQSEHFYVATDELYASNCIFFDCKSDISKGGAIFSRGTNLVKLSNSHFIRCSSTAGCGAFYISSDDFTIEFCCIDSCHALLDQACFIEGQSNLEVTNLGVIKCGLDGNYPGPCLEIHSYQYAEFNYLNVSHNSLKSVSDNTPLIDYYTYESFVNWYYSTINFNSADVVLMIHNCFMFSIEDTNIVYNNLSYLVFSLYDSYLYIGKCCIGDDEELNYDHPMASPSATATFIPIPTAPPAPTMRATPSMEYSFSDVEIFINQESNKYKNNKNSRSQLNQNADEKQNIEPNRLSSKERQNNLDESINDEHNLISSSNLDEKQNQISKPQKTIGPKHNDPLQLIAEKNQYLKRKQQLAKIFHGESSYTTVDFAQFHDSNPFSVSFIYIEESTTNFWNRNPDKIMEGDDCFRRELILINITEQDSCSNISSVLSSFDHYTYPINTSKSAFEFPKNASSIAIITILCIIAIAVISYVAVINLCPQALNQKGKEQKKTPA